MQPLLLHLSARIGAANDMSRNLLARHAQHWLLIASAALSGCAGPAPQGTRISASLPGITVILEGGLPELRIALPPPGPGDATRRQLAPYDGGPGDSDGNRPVDQPFGGLDHSLPVAPAGCVGPAAARANHDAAQPPQGSSGIASAFH